MIILNDSKPQLTTGIMELSNMLTHVKLTTFLILLLIGANLVAEADKSVSTSLVPPVSLNGIVIDQNSQKPLAGVTVKALTNGEFSTSATTDENGQFRLLQLETGECQILVSAAGYNEYSRSLDLQSNSDDALEIKLDKELIQLSPVVIIGESSTVSKQLTGTATKISSESVELIQPIGTQELLELVPGITGYADDGFGNSRLSIGIRGLNPRRSSRVLILEDGVPIQPAVYVYPNVYYNPPADRINAVEVVKGSSAIRFGPQTMGGVINYITDRPDGTKSLNFKLTAGSNRYRGILTELRGFVVGRSQSDLQILYKGGDGFRQNNAFNQINATLKTQLDLGQSNQLYVKANTNYEDSNATYTGLTEYSFENTPDFNPKADDNFKIFRPALDVIYSKKYSESLVAHTTLYANLFDRRWWREDDIFVRPSDLNSSSKKPIPYFQSGDLVRTGGGKDNFGILRTFYTGGIEHTYTYSHRIGQYQATAEIGGRVHWERFIDDKKVGNSPSAREGIYYTGVPGDENDPVKIVGQSHHYETMALALHAKEEIGWGRLTMAPGLRFEIFEQERVDRLKGAILADKVSAVLLPGLGFNYDLTPFNLFLGLHRGYTPPSSGALKVTNFGQDIESGGLDLKAETSWNLEIGTRFSQPWLTLETSGFWIKINDLVAAGRGTAFKNLGKVDTYGLELGAVLQPGVWKTVLPDLNLSYTFLQTEIKSGLVRSAIAAGQEIDLTGNQLPYAPPHTIIIGLSKEVGKKLRMRADMKFMDRVFTDFENTAKTANRGDMGPIPSYSILNASLDYALSADWQFFVTGKNLLDEIYIGSRLHSNPGQPQANLSSGILVGPRRQVNLGIRCKI